MTANLAAEQPAKSAESTSQSPITWTESYFIWSALNGDSGATCYGLNVADASGTLGAQIILYPWQGGQANELWSYESDQFVTNLSSNLVLGIGGAVPGLPEGCNYIVLVEKGTDGSEYWNVDPVTGMINNAKYPDLYLNVMGGQLQAGANLITYAAQPGAKNEMFAVLPAWAAGIQPSTSFQYFMNGLSQQQDGLNPFALTVQEGDTPLGVGLAALGSEPANQMWQLTTDGRMLSLYGSGNVLAVGAQLDGVWGVQVDLQQIPTTNGQQWSIGTSQSPQVLDNWQLSQSLYVPGGSPYDSPTPVLQSPPSNPDPGFIWYPMPANPLDSIITRPPQAFPFFTGGQLTAYQAANELLGFGQGDTPDFRGQYLNVGPYIPNTDLTTDISTLENSPTPPNVLDCDWTAVVKVLANEVPMVLAVQTLFANYNSWYLWQFAGKGAILPGLITDAQMDDQNVNAVALAIAQGALYTALEAIPEIGGVLGNVVNTAINAAVASRQASTTPFKSTVSTLYHDLSQQLTNIGGQATLMETAILSDWGKLQAVYPLTILASNDPSSLSASALGEANLQVQTLRGYSISAMQMLLPAKYQIYEYAENNQYAVQGIDSWNQYVSPNRENGVYKKFWIADSTSSQSTPSQTCMQTDIWDNGVSKDDFFNGVKGWGFARCYPLLVQPDSNAGVDCNGLVITITNQTPKAFTVNASPNSGQGITVNGPSTKTLQPYGSVSFIGYYTSGLAIDVTIMDPNLPGSDSVASFTAHQNECLLAGADVTVDPSSASAGYQLTTPVCNSGSYANKCPGALQIGIYLA